MFGPSAPADPAELEDWDEVQNKDAVALLYALGVVGAENEDGKFYYRPGKELTASDCGDLFARAEVIGKNAKPGEGHPNDQPAIAKDSVGFLAGHFSIPAEGLLEGIDPEACLTKDTGARFCMNALTLGAVGQKFPRLVLVAEDAAYDEFVIEENQVLVAPAGKEVTMTVGGVVTYPAPGTYKDVKLTLTASYLKTTGGPGGSHTHHYRTAVFVKDGEVVADKTIPAAYTGEVDGKAAKNVTIEANDHMFNGFMVMGGDYAIQNARITVRGCGGNDFQGYGAGIMTSGDAKVEIDGCVIHNEGAIRSAIWCGGQSIVNVKNTVVAALDSPNLDPYFRGLSVPMMKQVPFALGLIGNCRATNVLDQAQVTYEDSIVIGENWGALSTDSGQQPTSLLCKNILAGIGHLEVAQPGKEYTAKKTVAGVEYGFTMSGSGYISYGDGGVTDTFIDCEFYAPDYLFISPGTMPMTFQGVKAVSDRTGWMWHQTRGGKLIVEGGDYQIKDCAFQIKSGAYVDIQCSGAKIALGEGGTLIQQLESDDAGGIITRQYVVPEIEDDWSKVAPSESVIPDSTATFTDMDLTGNVFNSVYGSRHGLAVKFVNSKITGILSSTNANHLKADGTVAPGGYAFQQDNNDVSHGIDDYEVFDPMAYKYGGRLANKATPPVNNPVKIALEGSAWTVTGESFLTALSFDAASSIAGKVYLDGQEITAPGAYEGKIVVLPA